MTTRVVFLPGAGADPNFWRPVGQRLPATWSKSYLGWPGLGHNPPDSAVNSLLDLVGLVERQLSTEPVHSAAPVDSAGPVHLVAQSFGGAIALLTALRNPTKIARLVLVTSAAGLDVGHLGVSDWRPAYQQEYPSAAPWLYGARAGVDDRLSQITQPTLVIVGDADPISPVAVGRHLCAQLPNAKLHVVSGGTHALAEERADEVAPLIAAHLA